MSDMVTEFIEKIQSFRELYKEAFDVEFDSRLSRRRSEYRYEIQGDLVHGNNVLGHFAEIYRMVEEVGLDPHQFLSLPGTIIVTDRGSSAKGREVKQLYIATVKGDLSRYLLFRDGFK